jgi:hypothetical protein
MTPTLIDVYRQLLKTANLTVTADNMISGTLLGETEPVLVEGKRLVLPTDEFQAADKSEIVLFHPLAEQITRGSSPVLDKYRALLVHHLDMVASLQMKHLLRIASTAELHKDLSPDQSEFLSFVKEADEKTMELLEKVLDVMEMGQTARQPVSIFLKKTGTLAGKRHKRVGVVSFPLWQELQKPEQDIWGVACRKKDKETLTALLEFMFPQIGEPEAYNRGSDSGIATNLHALMQAALAVIEALNDITQTFDMPGKFLIDTDWQETFMNLSVLQAEIWRVPPQAGNEGVPWDEPQPAASVTSTAVTRMETHLESTRRPFTDMKARVASQPAVNSGVSVQSRPEAGLEYTKDGLDFSSVIRANPALANTGAPQVQPSAPPQTSQWAQRAMEARSRPSMFQRGTESWSGAGSTGGSIFPGTSGGGRRGLV